MSTEKLSELRKPVAWDFPGSKEESRQLGYDFELDDEQKVNCSPLYSQEYVSALLADRDAWQASAMALRDELRISQAIANEYQQLMYHMDAGGDFYEFQRDKAMKEQSNG
ncbi:hypothetical protein [Serratia ureilytica]|uniref:hypothetical protein n=1 Tax=Serratia ureilytica TaxID=300181 RepID=UPI00191CC860|nr:hypothetical protein [Serratia ureilytica]QQU63998.1 hypothetical protein I6I46_04180 [Serratia ureilytica]